MSSQVTHDIPLGNYVDLLPQEHPARLEYMRLVRGLRRAVEDRDYARGALRHAIDATRVELGDPPHAEPWPTWLAQWAAAYTGTSHDDQAYSLVEQRDTLARALQVVIPALRRAQGTIYQCGGDPDVRYTCERAEETARQAIAFQHDTDCNCATCLPDKPPPGYGA